MRTFAICSLLFVASVGVISTVPSISRLCSGGDDDEPSRPAFLFDPELTAEPEYRPLYFTWNKYYDNGWLDDSCTHNSNLLEWRRHFGDNVTLRDIGRVIYASTLEEVRHIDEYVKGESADLADSVRQNTLVQHVKDTGDLPFASYLLFAKRCEPYVTDFDPWDPEGSVARVKDSLLALLKEGKTLCNSCPSDFLRLRYGYQLVRLAHYSRQLEECRDIYDRYVEPSKVESIMRYWALEQKAGALRKLGLEAESSYLFSLVFDRCPSRRESSFSSFRITSDSAWNVCLSFCRTPRERTTLYFLRGMRPHGNAIEEMRNMYAVDPTSDQLNVLLVRELNKFEEGLLELKPAKNVAFYETYESFEDGKKAEIQSLRSLKEFVGRCVHETRVKNLDLWRLAQAYMEYMTAKYDQAKGMLEMLMNTTTNDSVRKQIGLFQLAVEVTRLRQISDVTEDNLFRKVLGANHRKLRILTVNAFEKLYQMKNDSIKAYLCNHDLRDLRANLDLALVNGVLDWRIRKVRTSVDSFFVEHRLNYHDENFDGDSYDNFRWYYYQYSDWPTSGIPALIDLKGTIFLGQNKLREAVDMFKQIPEGYIENLRGDPFKGRIRDCRDCDFAEKSEEPYSKLSLTLCILELLDKIKNDPTRAAEHHYRLGNAYYNMTHFGNAAEAIMYYRDPEQMWYRYDRKGKIPFFLDCSRALLQYDTAMKLAEASGNMELAAKSCFMAAKCEQNRYYVTLTEYDEEGTIKNSRFRKYFSRMRNVYKSTKFYNDAIKECKYFSYFVSLKR